MGPMVFLRLCIHTVRRLGHLEVTSSNGGEPTRPIAYAYFLTYEMVHTKLFKTCNGARIIYA